MWVKEGGKVVQNGARNKDESAYYNDPFTCQRGGPFDGGLSGSSWEMENPVWSRVHSIHEI